MTLKLETPSDSCGPARIRRWFQQLQCRNRLEAGLSTAWRMEQERKPPARLGKIGEAPANNCFRRDLTARYHAGNTQRSQPAKPSAIGRGFEEASLRRRYLIQSVTTVRNRYILPRTERCVRNSVQINGSNLSPGSGRAISRAAARGRRHHLCEDPKRRS